MTQGLTLYYQGVSSWIIKWKGTKMLKDEGKETICLININIVHHWHYGYHVLPSGLLFLQCTQGKRKVSIHPLLYSTNFKGKDSNEHFIILL